MAQVVAAHAVKVSPAGSGTASGVLSCGDTTSGAHPPVSGETRKITRISDHYEIGKKLGSGYTATVYEARCRATGHMVAVKDIDKSRQRLIASDDYYRLVYAALSCLPPHRHLLLPPVALLETPTHFYIVMELCHGRDLVEYVLNHPPGGISTSSCRRLMQQLLLGVHFLHSYNILHRDIKLDNIIFRQAESGGTDVGQTGDLALLDFDMCLLNNKDPPLPRLGSNEISIVGTREYMAPECFRGQYSTASDIWSLGVILYVLLDGHFPFDVNGCSSSKEATASASSANAKGAAAHVDPQQQQQQQQQSNLFSGRAIRRLLRQGVQFFSGVKARHPVATDLIERMLTFDVRARMQSAFDALHHPWLLPVPSPVPRQQSQQRQQQRQRDALLPILQEATRSGDSSAAATTWMSHEHGSAVAPHDRHRPNQQEQLLLLQQREAANWATLAGKDPTALARLVQPTLRHLPDNSIQDTIATHHVQHYLRQQVARLQQQQQQPVAQQPEQHHSAVNPAVVQTGYSLDYGSELRRSHLAPGAVLGIPKELKRHQRLQQQHQQQAQQQLNFSGQQYSLKMPQDAQLQQLSSNDFTGAPRSYFPTFGVAPLGTPAAPHQQPEAHHHLQAQPQHAMKNQIRDHQKVQLTPMQPREGATLSPGRGSIVSTRLPSSLPPSSQPGDFLGHVGMGPPLSPPSRFSCGLKGHAPSAAAMTCNQGSTTPYSSTTTASCSKPSTPTLESLPARRDDASATVAAQQQQQRSAGGHRTVSRTAPISGVSLMLQLQPLLQQQQQHLAQLQNRQFQLQHHLQQTVPRSSSIMEPLTLSAAEPARLKGDFFCSQGAPAQQQ